MELHLWEWTASKGLQLVHGRLLQKSNLSTDCCYGTPLCSPTANMKLQNGPILLLWNSYGSLLLQGNSSSVLYCNGTPEWASTVVIELQEGHVLLLRTQNGQLLLLWNSGMDIYCYYRTSEWACTLCTCTDTNSYSTKNVSLCVAIGVYICSSQHAQIIIISTIMINVVLTVERAILHTMSI